MAKSSATDAGSIWPLTDLQISGLFGQRYISIDLDSRSTILTGENGSGKSTILQAVHYLLDGEWASLAGLPLRGLSVGFSDGTRLSAEMEEDTVLLSNGMGDVWETAPSSQRSLSHRLRRELEMSRARMETARTREDHLRWRDRYEQTFAELERFRDAQEMDAPEWFQRIAGDLNTTLISARRLELKLQPGEEDLRRQHLGALAVVERFAREIADRMKTELSQYATESRSQERELPSKIVRAMRDSQSEDPEQLAQSVDELRASVRETADALARVGLLQDEDPDQQFTEYPRDNPNILLAIREVYRVTDERLRRLTRLQRELELFRDFLNSRLTSKRIDMSPQNGIEVVLDRGDRIRPSQLSSGEQQLLALGYELVFRAKQKSVVFIDEPELSLHVAWLQGLMSAFMDMGSSRELQFLIATHSPSVIAGYADLERSLDDLPQ